MGKTTIAAMLRRLKVPVHEADEEVHALLGPGGNAVKAVSKAFPFFRYPQIYGRKDRKTYINRRELGKVVFANDTARKKLENILHPLVRKAQNDFIRRSKQAGKKIVALDIPLLFETRGASIVDVTMVVSAPFKIQRARVLARPGMTEKKFRAILKSQIPDGEKRAYADYVIKNGLSRAHAMKQLKAALRDIKAKVK